MDMFLSYVVGLFKESRGAGEQGSRGAKDRRGEEVAGCGQPGMRGKGEGTG